VTKLKQAKEHAGLIKAQF